MIRIEGVTYTYPRAPRPALRNLNMFVDEGELIVAAGPSGAGKSTLLRLCNGLVPHYSGGVLEGKVCVGGRLVGTRPPRDMADLVGFVPQDPWAHATADHVTAELAFVMENLATPVASMRKRIEEVLDQLHLAPLRHRRLDTLSGGERQRVAIAAVLTAQPRLLVLDEPTSSLDPSSAEEVFSVLVRLRDELGLTILCSEHRLERVAAFADRIAWLDDDLVIGTPREVLSQAAFPPPAVHLGRALGWKPVPLTVRQARPFARELSVKPPPPRPQRGGQVVVEESGLRLSHDGVPVLRDAAIRLREGELTALVGRNGSGKTTLLRVLCGLATAQGASRRRRPAAGYLPQRAEALLYRDSVRKQVDDDAWMERLGIADLAECHPWDLSAGQQLRVALACILARRADVLFLDEPTRGLDAPGKRLLTELLHERCRDGTAVLLVTHDVELVAQAADRVVLFAEGAAVADGPTAQILGESLLFSSQTSKIMGDPRFLVPADVLG